MVHDMHVNTARKCASTLNNYNSDLKYSDLKYFTNVHRSPL